MLFSGVISSRFSLLSSFCLLAEAELIFALCAACLRRWLCCELWFDLDSSLISLLPYFCFNFSSEQQNNTHSVVWRLVGGQWTRCSTLSWWHFFHSLAHSRSPNPAKSLCEWLDTGTFCSTSTCEKSFMCHLTYWLVGTAYIQPLHIHSILHRQTHALYYTKTHSRQWQQKLCLFFLLFFSWWLLFSSADSTLKARLRRHVGNNAIGICVKIRSVICSQSDMGIGNVKWLRDKNRPVIP